MDTTILVENLYDEGKKLIEILDEQGYKYPITLWLNEDIAGWNLLFGIPGLKRTGSKEIFKNIHDILIQNNIDLSLNNITLTDSTSGICQNLRSMIKTGPGLNKIVFNGNIINGVRFPDSIIYRVN